MPKRSDRIRRLKRLLDGRLAALGITLAQAVDIACLAEEIEDIESRIETWGDEWSKDDHPHAPPRGCPRSGHTSCTGDRR